jgi:hypothetical protein
MTKQSFSIADGGGVSARMIKGVPALGKTSYLVDAELLLMQQRTWQLIFCESARWASGGGLDTQVIPQ